MIKKIYVLEVARMEERAGIETFLINLLRNIDRSSIQIDFLRPSIIRGPFDDEIEQMGSKIYYVPAISKSISGVKNHYNELNNFYEAHPYYDVVHIHGNTGISLVDSKFFFKHNIPCIIGHSHNNSAGTLKHKIEHYLLRKHVTKFLSLRVACSTSAWNWMFGKDNNHNAIIARNGIELKKFSFDELIRQDIRKRYGLIGKIVYGSVGRLTKQKNYSHLIKAFSDVCKYNRDCVLMLIGDGEERDDLLALARELGIESKVIFTGFVGNVNDYLQAFDVFVLTSLWEGLGICLIEAQAAGLPCVVSERIVPEAKIIPELINSIINYDDIYEWSRVMRNVKIYDKRGNFSTMLKQQGYDVLDSAKNIEQLYKLWGHKRDEKNRINDLVQ